MAIIIRGAKRGFANKIKNEIALGRIYEWEINKNGNIFHRPSFLIGNKAWLMPSSSPSVTGLEDVEFNVIRAKDGHISSTVYASIHSLFAQMLLINYDTEFETVAITALATKKDLI